MADTFAADAGSMSSVCPSEPGLALLNSPSSSDEGDSVEDLYHPEKRQAPASFLLPTSSLPNLHPFNGDPGMERFLTSPLYNIPYRGESSYMSGLANRNNSNNAFDGSPLPVCGFDQKLITPLSDFVFV